MKAVLFERFAQAPQIATLPDPLTGRARGRHQG